MSAEPDDITRPETGRAPVPAAADCSVCLEFDWAEEDAERVGDLSLATDCRILRRRHQAAEHPAEVEADRTASPDARTASIN